VKDGVRLFNLLNLQLSAICHTPDYVLYNFITKNVKPEDLLSIEKQIEYNRLLNLFIKDYKFPMTAKVKFGQCGSITFTPKK
jgi:hypothetical protein